MLHQAQTRSRSQPIALLARLYPTVTSKPPLWLATSVNSPLNLSSSWLSEYRGIAVSVSQLQYRSLSIAVSVSRLLMDSGLKRPRRVPSLSHLTLHHTLYLSTLRYKTRRLESIYLPQPLPEIRGLPEGREKIFCGDICDGIHSRSNSIELDQELSSRNYHDRLNCSLLGLHNRCAQHHWHNMLICIVLSLEGELGNLPSSRPFQPLQEIRGITGSEKTTFRGIGRHNDSIPTYESIQREQEVPSSNCHHGP